MPQVIGGEIGRVQESQWVCGECRTAGSEYKDSLAKVLMHCATQHDAWDTAQDKDKLIVSIKSRRADK